MGIPAQTAKLSRPQYQKEYQVSDTFEEVSSRYISGPQRIDKTKYKFTFTFKLNRHDKKKLPDWAKEMKEQPLETCHFYKDGESLIVKSTYFKTIERPCELEINEYTISKVAGAKFIEVRALDRAGEEFYRSQYSLQHPDIVKQSAKRQVAKLIDAMKTRQCKPVIE